MGDILSNISRAILPGARVPRVRGWEGALKFAMARDAEAILLDEDDSKDHMYMKYVDKDGNEICERYHYTRDPVKEFNPDEYITKEEFNALREEMHDGINSVKEYIRDALLANPAAATAPAAREPVSVPAAGKSK